MISDPADFREKSNDQPGTCLRQQFLPQAVRVVDSSTRNHKPSHTGINTELVYTNNSAYTTSPQVYIISENNAGLASRGLQHLKNSPGPTRTGLNNFKESSRTR